MSNDDYLWDRSGEPDPEVRRLEEALEPLRHRGAFDAGAPLPASVPRGRLRYRLARTAAAVLVMGLAALPFLRTRTLRPPAPAGDVVETNAQSETRIELGSIGRVEVGPSTRIRLLDRGTSRYRLALDRGSLHALVWAPPGAFQVETPSARAVDLGCEYTLVVDDEGDGLLTVETGWVAFEHHGQESFVPAGARCATRRDRGPGIPYYLDAPPSFRQSLSSLESLAGAGPERSAALGELLSRARPRDAMTLWHLLARASGEERAQVYVRMAAIAPPPAGVTRARVLAGDEPALDAWWNELGLGGVGFWRTWKADWTAANGG